MDFLQDFGVKPVLLIAQIVNFLILLYILKRLLYGPILKVLDERKQKIADSLKNAEEIEKRLEEVTIEREKRIKDASREAEKIVKEATQSAGQIITDAHLKAGADVEKIIEKSRQSLNLEREKMYKEVRADLANMIAVGLEKVAGKTLNKKDQEELIKESIKEL